MGRAPWQNWVRYSSAVAGVATTAKTTAIDSGAPASTRARAATTATVLLCIGLPDRLDTDVGVGQGGLPRVQDGLHLVQPVPHQPHRPAGLLPGPGGDRLDGQGAEAEQLVQFGGD